MNTNSRSRWPIAVAALTLGIVACTCGGLGNAAPTPTPASPPTPTPPPAEIAAPTKPPIIGEGTGGGGGLSIINAVAAPRSDGGWRLMGEVANNSDSAASSLSLNIEWFDSSGASLGSDTGYILTTNVAPGESSPFLYNIYDAGVPVASFAAEVTEFTTLQDLSRASFDIEHAVLTVDEFGDFHCTGELVNNGSVSASLEGLAAAIVDSSGALVSADSYWAVARHLEPGARTPFRISPLGFSGAAASAYSCSVYVDAVTADPIGLSPVAFVDTNGDGDNGNDILFYIDAFGSSHLVGEITNNGSEPMAVQLIAGLYNANGETIDADFASAPIALDPGQTLPFDFTTLSAINYNEALRGEVSRFFVLIDPFWTFPTFTQQVQLQPQNGSASNDNGTVVETVDIFNDQTFNVDYAYVLVKVTDASGQVVGYSFTSTDPITAGASVSASVTLYVDPALDPSTLTVTVTAYALKP
ncbi:MAG: hypothetical protein FJ030_03815 [Chloroflexi bacterium]|nr:hypothetical protein [Chloroflexota bacterium]